jgi:hypothetical protein
LRCEAKAIAIGLLWVVLLPGSQYGWARDGLIESAWGPAYVLCLVAAAAGILVLWRCGSSGDAAARWISILPGVLASYAWSTGLWFLVGTGSGGGPLDVMPAGASGLGGGQILAVLLGGAAVLALSWGPVLARRTIPRGAEWSAAS